ncbi:MAG TPA: protein translocase subunit SecF [Thermoleophilia bacterium]|nr:protein translocase subunit SecF [Thermoleophilia bacterium]HQG02916.1 protein translocase subunit SecF [Thermoleophilia bacterium]HQG54438.1 protein translocase subunit SecF [Thermoleophilia bacterium]HQJ97274.1 protein translocase subunit SecF [Thermoleophilia bacterium]
MSFLRKIYSFDFMGHRPWYFVLSGIVIGAGLVSLFVRGGGNPVHGLNYGLEFKEGTRIEVAFDQPVSLADVRAVLAEAGHEDAQIQESSAVGGTSLPGFTIQVETLSPGQQARLRDELDKAFTIATEDGSRVYAVRTVGPTFGSEVVTSSYEAALLALLLIVAYVTIRFDWKFAVGALSAELHDLLVMIGVYSLSGREVTTATVAAVLTILGYSLYDSVIISDRIRENSKKLARMSYAALVNRSLSETLTRSLITSFTTLLPVLCLLFFGGTTLTDFAFALTVGIISGAYSTIFISSPIVTSLKEREPQYRRLMARADQEA